MRLTKAEQQFATARIAVSRVYTDHNGDRVKETQWFRIVGWGPVAERMHRQLRKGSRVLIEGRLSCKVYETKEGQKRESVEVYVAAFQELEQVKYSRSAKTVVISGETAPQQEALAA